MESFDLRLWSGFAECVALSDQNEVCRDPIIDQVAIDSRRIHSPNCLFIALEGEKVDGHDFVSHAAQAGARFALVRKGWKPPQEIGSIVLLHVENPLKGFQEIAKTYRNQMKALVVAIGGSYGKTMVKDLLQALLMQVYSVVSSPESFNSQIGVPLSLFQMGKGHQVALIEAAVSKRGEMNSLANMILPDFGILTPVGKKHEATLGGREVIASEMSKLFAEMKSDRWILIPDDPLVKDSLQESKPKIHFWNCHEPSLPWACFLEQRNSFTMSYRIAFPDGADFRGEVGSGYYYHLDLLHMAIKAAWLLGVPSKAICSVLKDYSPESMRTEIWKIPNGAALVNEVYCADPQSIDQALRHFQYTPSNGRKLFVFGGMRCNEEQNSHQYRRVGKALRRSPVDILFLIGEHPFQPLIDELHPQDQEIVFCRNDEEALDRLQERVRPLDQVLLKGSKKIPFEMLANRFGDSVCNNYCLINLAAVKANIAAIRQKLPPHTRLMVMVKALAYGTDAVRISNFMESCGVDILGVSYVEEGVFLRRAGVAQSIFTINASRYEAFKAVEFNLEVGVGRLEEVEALALEASRTNKKVKVHLHIDTGMGRFGCKPDEAVELSMKILSFPVLIFEGIMTHFACADDPLEDAFTMRQAAIFEEAIQKIEAGGYKIPWKHAVNSAAMARFYFPQFNMARIGLGVYGLYASDAAEKAMDLRLAFSLQTRIAGINICRRGDTVSYGRSYSVQKDLQRIAVLPIGYFDGLHRSYSGKGCVAIRGQLAPMVGKICMDFMMVDVTDIPFAEVGDPVLIFGEDEHGMFLPPEQLAVQGNSIVHELITCLGPRIQRIFIYEEARKMR